MKFDDDADDANDVDDADEDVEPEPITKPVNLGVPGGPPPMSRSIQPRARQQRRRKRK